MRHIPFQRYAGHVSAYGTYGLPTLAGRQVSGRTLLILGLVGFLFTLYAFGVLDGHAAGGIGLALGAGPTTQELGSDLHKIRTEQEAFFTKHRKEDGSIDITAEQIGEARKRNEDITKAAKAYEDALDLDNMAASNGNELKRLSRPNGKTELTDPSTPVIDGDGRRTTKSLGELFVESDAFKNWVPGSKQGPVVEIDLAAHYGKAVAARGVKALFDTVTGYVPQAVRLPDVVTPGFEVASVASLLPQGRTSQNAVPYMEETTTTNAAAEVAQGVAKPESEIKLTEKSSAVRKIATHLPITDEALEDVPMIESYIDTRLRTFVQLRENQQLLTGNGAAPNLRGILATVGILTQAKGGDPTPDAFYKAGTKIRVASFFEPTDAVVHPNDWEPVRLLRTADGIYIWGSPSEAGPERIWGWNVLQTASETENTGLVGAFRAGAQIFRRSEVAMSIGWINDQFITNQRTILVEERLALVVFRPSCFATVTGI